jgi:hypothetical protein
MPRKPSGHAQLDQLRQAAAGERVKRRELETELDAAKAAVDQASQEITEAYAAENQRAVTTARKAEDAAVARVRELQHRLDGAGIVSSGRRPRPTPSKRNTPASCSTSASPRPARLPRR